MRAVHRVAWRMEKPRRLSLNLACAVWLVVCAVGYFFGWWHGDRFTAGGLCLVVAINALVNHLEAQSEYAQYLRIKEVAA